MDRKIETVIKEAIKKERARVARLGGQARAKKLTAKRRKEIATDASRKAAKKRTERAKEKRVKT